MPKTNENKKIKTTITINGDLWTRFGVIVLREYGERKKGKILAQLIKEYVDKKELA